jgi:hypothetical protein
MLWLGYSRKLVKARVAQTKARNALSRPRDLFMTSRTVDCHYSTNGLNVRLTALYGEAYANIDCGGTEIN